VRLDFPFPGGMKWRLSDRLGTDVFEKNSDDLRATGLSVDMKPWQASVFEFEAIS
jgi:hypothetical protein